MHDWQPIDGLERGTPIGAGARGTVFRVAQSDGDGDVAVLVLHAHLAERRELMSRLEQEVGLARRIKNDGVARVFGFVAADDRPYVVMEFVEGLTLRQYLDGVGTASVAATLDITKQLAAGLAAMHAQGLPHRNLTPANVKLGLGHVKILDAGTAPQHEIDPSGATAYIAPERAAGRRATPQADLYALGIICYELLAGVPPFRADTPLAVLDLHRTAAPPSLATFRDDIPAVVHDLVGHLLAKDPGDRPPSADEVRARIEDIQATEQGLEATKAGTAPDRFQAGSRRDRGAVSSGTVSRRQLLVAVSATALGGAAVAAGAAGIATLVARRQPPVQVERMIPQEVIKVVTVDRVVTRDIVREVPVDRVVTHEVVREVPVERIIERVVTPAATATPTPSATPTPLQTVVAGRNASGRFALDPGNVALPIAREPIRAANASRLRQLQRFGLGKANAVVALPGGKEFAIGSSAGLISVFDGFTGDERLRWLAAAAGTSIVSLAAVGDTLVSGQANGAVSAWDATDGRRRWEIQLDSEVTSLAIDAAGEFVAAAERSGSVSIRNATTGALVLRLTPPGATTRAAVFHPRRRELATGSDDGSVVIWDLETGTAMATFGDAETPVRALAFNPAATLLAAAEAGGSVGIWNVSAQTRQSSLDQLQFDADDVAFGRSGTWVAATDGTERVVVWDTVSGTVIHDLQDRDGAVTRGSLAVADDGASLACAVRHLAVAVWDLSDGRLRRRVGAYGDATRVALSGDASLAAVAYRHGAIDLVQLPDGLPAATIDHYTGLADSLQFSPDGSRLASGGPAEDSPLRLWDTASGAAAVGFDPANVPAAPIRAAAYGPGGGLLATGWDDGVIRIWDTASWALTTSLSAHVAPVNRLHFGPGGAQLASSDTDGVGLLWDIASATSRPLASEGVPVRAVAIHRNGGPIAGALDDGGIALWDVTTGSLIQRLESPESGTLDVAFSPIAPLLISGHRSGTLRLWDSASGEPLGVLEGHQAPIVTVQFSLAGDLMASSAFDGTARLWGVPASN